MDKRVNYKPGFSATAGEPRQVTAKRHRLNSTELFGGAREVIIEHALDEYRLRLTSQGKLILTK